MCLRAIHIYGHSLTPEHSKVRYPPENLIKLKMHVETAKVRSLDANTMNTWNTIAVSVVSGCLGGILTALIVHLCRAHFGRLRRGKLRRWARLVEDWADEVGFGPLDDLEKAADGVEFLVAVVGVEVVVEVIDRGQRADRIAIAVVGGDELVILRIVLVVDLANDFLQDVLNGDQAGDTAVFVDHDRHMVVRGAEVLEQYVQVLRFGDENRRTQEVVDIEFFGAIDEQPQQVFGQQDTEYFVVSEGPGWDWDDVTHIWIEAVPD